MLVSADSVDSVACETTVVVCDSMSAAGVEASGVAVDLT